MKDPGIVSSWRDAARFVPVAVFVVAFWGVVFLTLSGCATGPVYRPPVLINGYDPTLSSHAEALGLKEPYRP